MIGGKWRVLDRRGKWGYGGIGEGWGEYDEWVEGWYEGGGV